MSNFLQPDLQEPADLSSGDSGLVRDVVAENLFDLLRKEVVAPLRKIADLARRLEELREAGHISNTKIGEQLFSGLEETSRQCALTINRLLNLTEVVAAPPLRGNDRMLLPHSFRAVAASLAEPAVRRRVGLRIDDAATILAPIYASKYWLELALGELTRRVFEATPSGMHVLVTLRQIGFHQLVTVVSNHAQGSGHDKNLLARTPGQLPPALSGIKSATHMDIAIARSIVELHGGKLKIEIDPDGAILQFTLTMPTGEQFGEQQARRCEDCPHAKQAELFAADIGELLQMMEMNRDDASRGEQS